MLGTGSNHILAQAIQSIILQVTQILVHIVHFNGNFKLYVYQLFVDIYILIHILDFFLIPTWYDVKDVELRENVFLYMSTTRHLNKTVSPSNGLRFDFCPHSLICISLSSSNSISLLLLFSVSKIEVTCTQ